MQSLCPTNQRLFQNILIPAFQTQLSQKDFKRIRDFATKALPGEKTSITVPSVTTQDKFALFWSHLSYHLRGAE